MKIKEYRKYRDTLLLCSLFGLFGFHRFYTKNYGRALIMFFSLGGLGILVYLDFIKLINNEYKDGDGFVVACKNPGIKNSEINKIAIALLFFQFLVIIATIIRFISR